MDDAKDDGRRAGGLRLADELRQDARYALRGLRRSRVFASIAVASLALGIGANTAIFSFVDAVLLQRLAVPEPDRLVTFAQTHRGERTGVVWPLTTIDEFAARTPAFDGVFGWFSRPMSLSRGNDGRWVNGELVTGRYYRTLRASPAVGRLLNEDDMRNAAADPVCVLGYGLWQRAFGGDPGVVGRTVFLNGRGYRVVGVTARGFHGAELHRRFDVGVPATRIRDFLPAFGGAAGAQRLNDISWLVPMARLQDGVTRTEAERQARLALQAIDPERQGAPRLDDGSRGFNPIGPAFGRPLLVAMGLAALVLLVACANLANLLLARARARAGEFGVRLCVGASRARLVRQLLVETSVLSAAGGIGGVALSFWIVGVVADARDRAVRSGPADAVYVHPRQGPPSGMTLLARAGDDPERIVPALLALAGSIDLRMPITSVHALDVDVAAGISSERMLGILSTLFAGLTLLLSGIGLYGALASAVVRRTREIGLRIALGARGLDIAVLLGRETMALLFLGAVAGGLLALACARVLQGVLFGVTATDVPTLAASLLLLGAVALLATAAPLRRASRVDPMVALR